MNEVSEEVQGVLKRFMVDMKTWEQTNRRAAETALGKDAPYSAMKEFRLKLLNQVLSKYCSPEIEAVDFRTGSPTYYDPKRERIVRLDVAPDGDSAEVVTDGPVSKGSDFRGYSWKYVLRRYDVGWRVVSRQCRESDKSKFHSVPLY